MFQRAPLPPASTERTMGVGGQWSVGDVGALPNAYAEAKVRGRPKSQAALSDTERSRLRRARLATRTEIVISGAPENTSPLAQVSPVKSAKPVSTAKGISGAQNRYVSVTRTETLKSEQKRPFIQSFIQSLDLSCPIGLDVFCDWITIYQDHGFDLPVINDGFVVRFEPDAFRKSIDTETGELRPMFDATKAEYTVSRRMEHEGSFETKVSVRCDGRRVELSGNVGRFGRPDNLFGLPVIETIERANEILAALGLPPFTGCDKATPFARTDSFSKGHNAVITRVDLTANFATGSREAAFRCLHWMSGQGTARNSGKNPRNYGNGVTWNEGSKRHYEKLYYKADELGAHVSEEVRDYCNQNGILRYEVSLKSRELADRNLQSIAGWSYVTKEGTRMENVIYGKFAEVLTRNQVTVTECQKIPGKLGFIAKSYLNGENPYEAADIGISTRRRWRAQLREYGLDIAQPIDVTRMQTRIRVIELQPVAAPSWYSRSAA